jgi:hypothetical protein
MFGVFQASMASGVVDVCLIPEVNFALYGEKGLFAYLEKVLETKGHAVVCIAEGAGQVRSLEWSALLREPARYAPLSGLHC